MPPIRRIGTDQSVSAKIRLIRAIRVLFCLFYSFFWANGRFGFAGSVLIQNPKPPIQTPSTRSRAAATDRSTLTVVALPESVIYLNEIRRGTTDAGGKLVLQAIEPGSYRLRVRKTGRQDYRTSFRLLPGRKGQVKAVQPVLTDQSELRRQRGDEWLDKKLHQQAITEYKKAIELRKGPFPRARVGLARALLAFDDYEEATRQVNLALRESKNVYPEARAVLGNILRTQGLYEDAAKEYRIALKQAKNFSPEAHTGLALTLDELGKPDEAIQHLRIAIRQNADTEPVLYYLLGNILLNENRTKEAITAYENFLELAPQSETAPAIRSLVEQLRKEIKSEE